MKGYKLIRADNPSDSKKDEKIWCGHLLQKILN